MLLDGPGMPVERIHRDLEPQRRVLAAHDAELVAAQVAVSQIASPTGAEAPRGAWIAREFRARGLTGVRTDEAGNVVGRRQGAVGTEPVVVCAHLDTVFPADTDVGVRVEGSRLIGPGITDNSRGLAVMLALAATRFTGRRPIEFVATTGEEGEGDLRGAKAYFASTGSNAAAMIALDGAGDERVVHRALGSRRFRVTYRGPGGHSWAAFGAPNAVQAAAAATTTLARISLPAAPRTTLSVCRIGGGHSVNSIPSEAWLEVDIRSVSTSWLERMEEELLRIVHGAAQAENGARSPGSPELGVSVVPIGSRPCGETPAEHPLVRAAVAATRAVGRDAELSLASTDANVPIALGIPAIAIGAGGRGGAAHTPNEWYDNRDGQRGVARALTILAAAAA